MNQRRRVKFLEPKTKNILFSYKCIEYLSRRAYLSPTLTYTAKYIESIFSENSEIYLVTC